jgi:antitoxin (DNA-binding transcriptional repressor) of toxin-antitoxin stability system
MDAVPGTPDGDPHCLEEVPEDCNHLSMRRVGIAELKNRLSHYLRYVRGGESLLVYDRERAIARIEPVRGELRSDEEWTAELERSGALTAPAAALPADWLAQRPRVQCDVVRAVLEERESGR